MGTGEAADDVTGVMGYRQAGAHGRHSAHLEHASAHVGRLHVPGSEVRGGDPVGGGAAGGHDGRELMRGLWGGQGWRQPDVAARTHQHVDHQHLDCSIKFQR